MAGPAKPDPPRQLPAPSSPLSPLQQEPQQPATLVDHLRALGRTATAVGDRLQHPEKITLGEVLRLFKLAP